ncbi:MAG TPA: protein phosphatase 2C domain-containing protein [Longimicrobiales bacterium]|nr:protein phosphatase 2C domain-containing protein [Longimicrobiales bacterium]
MLSPDRAGDAVRKPRNDEIDVFGITHPGHVRPENQDHFLIGSLGNRLSVLQTSLPNVPVLDPVIPGLPPTERAAFLAAVADGVGGGRHGEEASRLAVEAVTLYIARTLHCYYTTNPANDDDFIDALRAAARETHEEILRRDGGEDRRHGMATTLTLWLGIWPRAYVLQVGDSRYYLLRNGELTQVSRDQTVAQELIDQGVLSWMDASRTRWANVLSSAIGGPQSVPIVTSIRNDWTTTHLLCSDGLTKHVSDAEISRHLAGMTSARQACEDLLQAALDGGGRDNISIVVGRAVARENV